MFAWLDFVVAGLRANFAMSITKLILVLFVVAFIGAAQGLLSETLLMQLKQICTDKSGSDEGYQQLLASLEPTKTCFQKHLNEQQLKADFKLVYFGMTRVQFSEKYCPQLKESLSCLHELFEGVEKCVGNDGSQALKEKAYNYVDQLCHNYGQMLYEILQKKFYDENETSSSKEKQ